jgi:hypothetical protein
LDGSQTEEGSGMLEIVAAAGLVAGIVVALTRAAPSNEAPPPVRRRALVSAGSRVGLDPGLLGPQDDLERGFPLGFDLPCPWCRSATSESDRRCPSCGQPFG